MPIDCPMPCPYCKNRMLTYYQTVGALDFYSCDSCMTITSAEMIEDDLAVAV
jgi:pyruvate-formate lyase-activating enzyme